MKPVIFMLIIIMMVIDLAVISLILRPYYSDFSSLLLILDSVFLILSPIFIHERYINHLENGGKF